MVRTKYKFFTLLLELQVNMLEMSCWAPARIDWISNFGKLDRGNEMLTWRWK